jgi:hypothetical protein
LTREDFEHAIKAAAEVVEDEIVVVGSQAILAQHPDAPSSLLRSMEVDLFPRTRPERAAEIDGALGDGSRFHATYGYYAHAVGPETSKAPAGWGDRLVRIELAPFRQSDPPVIAWCLEPHDLVLAKLAAGRPHDLEFALEAIRAGLVDREQLRLGLELMTDRQEPTRERLEGLLARIDSGSAAA